jgi:hypothetical protein
MYKEEYGVPLMEVIHFENEDIITTSFDTNGGEGGLDSDD